MDLRGHDIVIVTDGGDVPLIRGLKIDGRDYLVPTESIVSIGADLQGTMTATFTLFARSIHSTDGTE